MTCDYNRTRLHDVMHYRTDHEQVINVALQIVNSPNISRWPVLAEIAANILKDYLEGK